MNIDETQSTKLETLRSDHALREENSRTKGRVSVQWQLSQFYENRASRWTFVRALHPRIECLEIAGNKRTAAQYLKVKVRTLLLWVRQGKVRAFALSGTKRRVWRFRRQDLDAALLESPVLPSIPLSVRSEREDFLKRAARVNQGSVVFNKRFGTWNFLWCENGHRRSKVIGTDKQFPTKASAWRAAEPLRKQLGPDRKDRRAVIACGAKSGGSNTGLSECHGER